MKTMRCVISLFLLCIMLCLTPMSVLAIDDRIDVCYTINENNERVSMPQMYRFLENLRGSYDGMEMSNPNDLCIASDGKIYVADTGNSRILKFSERGEYICSFDNGEESGLITPKGVATDEEQNIYIADSGNQRIVVLDQEGHFQYAHGKPDSDMLSGLAVYEPTKIDIGINGTLNVLVGKEFMSLSKDNEFLGYVGSADVGFSLKNLLINIFASERQKKLITKVQPDTYNNFTISDSGMIYAVSYGLENQIKKITSVGDNIYPNGKYGEYGLNQWNIKVRPNFSDIAVSDSEIIFVSELNTGRIYQYDRNGQLLSVFGGSGSGEGLFLSISAIDVDAQGNLYVLDSGYGQIQVFHPTYFNELILEASDLYENGEYDASYEKWMEVLDLHDSYPIALSTVAKILYKNKDFVASQEYYQLVDDQEGYGKANGEVKHEWVSEHFLLVCLILFAVFIAVLVGVFKFKRYADKMNHDLNYGVERKRRKKSAGGIKWGNYIHMSYKS